MIHKIEHNYKEEIVVPLISIYNNIEFLNSTKQKIETEDGVECEVLSVKQIHILDDESIDLITSLYGVSEMLFMKKWYIKYGSAMQSLVFVYIKLKKC